MRIRSRNKPGPAPPIGSEQLQTLSHQPGPSTPHARTSSPIADAAAAASRAPRAAKPTASPFFSQHYRSRTSNPSHIEVYTPTLTSFHSFPHLPIELRLKIWSHALTTPRIFLFTSSRHSSASQHDEDNTDQTSDTQKNFHISLPHPPPALLKSCRESRFEALKVYEPAFGYQLEKPFWFARETDVLMFVNGLDLEHFFERDWAKSVIDETEKDKVVNVAVMMEEDCIIGKWTRDRQVVRAKDLFQRLGLLVFVGLYRGMLSWDEVKRLLGQDGDLVKFLQGVRSRKERRGRKELDVVEFTFYNEAK